MIYLIGLLANMDEWLIRNTYLLSDYLRSNFWQDYGDRYVNCFSIKTQLSTLCSKSSNVGYDGDMTIIMHQNYTSVKPFIIITQYGLVINILKVAITRSIIKIICVEIFL